MAAEYSGLPHMSAAPLSEISGSATECTLIFSTSDSSDVLLLSKVRHLEIFGRGPVPSRERTPPPPWDMS